MKALSLYELNHIVRSRLSAVLDDSYWLAAELSEVRQSTGGHCYVEFVEKDAKTQAYVAKAKGNIWRNVYSVLSFHFEKETGQPLQPGLKVLVEVKPEFHELYGYSLTILDIDPVYTLGDIYRRRKEIVAQLQADGVFTMNKELPLPRPLRRIAVVSSPTAAGYGDFCHQIAQSGFPFELKLFSAAMQGEQVEASVIKALDEIAKEMDDWDAVVIIRGGGAVSDLNSFDSYFLATNVAQFPLPVLTGIGHERDDTVVDLVAHTRLKTPTAVAAFLIQLRKNEVELLDNLLVRQRQAIGAYLEKGRANMQYWAHRMESATLHYSARRREQLSQCRNRLLLGGQNRLRICQIKLAQIPQQLEHFSHLQITRNMQQLSFYKQTIQLANPERILSMGYSITCHEGKVVKHPQALKKGDKITTQLSQGTIVSVVE